MKPGSRPRACALVALLACAAAAPAARAALGGPPNCQRFGLIASTLQADFLAGRSFQDAQADGMRLLGPEHPRQSQILQRLARTIYESPDSRRFSPPARAQQVQMQCLQALRAQGR
ncbi:hypothetical protein [Thiomonas sp. FB-6]|uniref:hypothetical protein n=1 Tax=Thiomonas sp. FB-6 TaxID=1158291 RepID=UPI00037B8DBE|nr:hypothetical protein [Thiomonas sp. FB-6]